MNKILLTLFVSLLTTIQIYSQTKISNEFSDVKSADDVLQNHIKAIGGRDLLDTLQSIFFTGELMKDGKSYKFNCFMSRTRFHYTIDDKEVKELTEFGRENIQYLNLPIYEHSGLTTYSGFIFYLAYKFDGIKSMLDGVRVINGRECYKIDFTYDKRFIKTAYFDKQTFHKLKTINRDYEKEKFEINFSEFKEVNETGIVLPFKVESIFNFNITEYLLNEEPEIEW
jgi:hypothetical protein